MCKDCKHALKDGNRLICMCEESAEQYEYVPKYYACDGYEPNES